MRRIAQKIGEEKGNPFIITDMLRAIVQVNKPEEIITAYKIIKTSNWQVIRVKNKLQTHLQNVHLNLIYDNSIIAEI